MKLTKNSLNLFFMIIGISFFISCADNPPAQVDGEGEAELLAVWERVTPDSTVELVPLANAEIVLVSEYGTMKKYADDLGKLLLSNIPSAVYQISARKKLPDAENIYIVGSLSNVEVFSGKIVNDTIFTKPTSASGLSINEIYAGGPVNSIYFFYDQFIEIYNSSDKIKYLDGMQIFRVSSSRALCADGYAVQLGDPGADWDDDGSVNGVTYAFKFPGKPGEENYPIQPEEFIVLAQDAIDHRKAVATSIDLSHADFEFVNQYNAVDVDNPDVPNLSNLLQCKTTDFMISLTSDIVILASGADTNLVDGIDIETILDGVEYQSSGSKRITLDERVDRSWVQSPPKYSGQSMQRRQKGVDTNDGTLDWHPIELPTPGWQ